MDKDKKDKRIEDLEEALQVALDLASKNDDQWESGEDDKKWDRASKVLKGNTYYG